MNSNSRRGSRSEDLDEIDLSASCGSSKSKGTISPSHHSKYLEAEKVPVRLVRNCGLLLEDDEGFCESSQQQKRGSGKWTRHKKDSIFQPSHKIPIEIRRNNQSANKKGWRKYGGIIFGVLSSLCFSCTVLLAKVLYEFHEFHPICITVWRYAGILLPALFIAIYYQCLTKENIFKSVWPLNKPKHIKNCCGYLMQGICGCTSIIFRFYSLKFLSVADTSVISYSSPVFVIIFAHFCLKEKCGLVSILLAFITAAGVFVIARPPMLTGSATYSSKLWVGAMLAVVSMICASGLIILLRNIRQVHYSLLLLISGGWGVFQSAILGFTLNIMKYPETLKEILFVALLCILTFCGQSFIILALKYEDAGPVSIVRSSEVIFAFIWQLQFLNVYPDIFSLAGGGIIILAVVLTATKTWVTGLPVDNVHRKRLSCLLI